MRSENEEYVQTFDRYLTSSKIADFENKNENEEVGIENEEVRNDEYVREFDSYSSNSKIDDFVKCNNFNNLQLYYLIRVIFKLLSE